METTLYRQKMETRPRRGFTRDEALRFVSYNPDTGAITWNHRVQCFGGGRPAGSLAGTTRNGSGYSIVIVFGKTYRAHHLAWLIMTGEWPPVGDMDHVNRDRSDNRWANLRLATRAENNVNSKTRISKSGHRGVHPTRCGNKWTARISVDRRIVLLGTFGKIEDAIAARVSAESLYYKNFSSKGST